MNKKDSAIQTLDNLKNQGGSYAKQAADLFLELKNVEE